MAQIYKVLTSCQPASQPDTYIYEIVPTIDQKIAVITSNDELILLAREDLRASGTFTYGDVPKDLTCLVGADDGQRLVCAGRKGDVSTFDLRMKTHASHFKIDRAVTALACQGNNIALGTELAHQEAIVSLWDRRANKMLWRNPENNDDITAVAFHPRQANILVGGGDDGQVSVFDTFIAEEDDSLVQGVNHGPIHKAGFLDEGHIYALSSDQNLSIYPLTVADEVDDKQQPLHLKDVRNITPCEYVINIFQAGSDAIVATGSHSESRVELLKLGLNTGLDLDQRVVIEAAHGNEIVRSIFVDTTAERIYTAGEDGKVAVYSSSLAIQSTASISKPARGNKAGDVRFRPY